jgi:hypothetical protein
VSLAPDFQPRYPAFHLHLYLRHGGYSRGLEYFQTQIPLKIVTREPQKNWVANTNYLLNIAQSDYVCFLHQDDMWLPQRLMILKKLTLQFPEANLILNPSIFVNIQGQKLGLWRCPLPSYPIMISSEQMIGKLLVQNFISIPAPIFKREMALKVGGLDEKLWYTADWDFWLKLAQYGQIIYYPKPLSVFRIHSHSQTVTRSSYIQDFRQQLESVIDEHLEAWNTSSQTKSKIRKIANFSKEVNIALASIIHGKKVKISFLVQGLFSLGFLGIYKFFRDSRVLERIIARMRAKLNQVN